MQIFVYYWLYQDVERKIKSTPSYRTKQKKLKTSSKRPRKNGHFITEARRTVLCKSIKCKRNSINFVLCSPRILGEVRRNFITEMRRYFGRRLVANFRHCKLKFRLTKINISLNIYLEQLGGSNEGSVYVETTRTRESGENEAYIVTTSKELHLSQLSLEVADRELSKLTSFRFDKWSKIKHFQLRL